VHGDAVLVQEADEDPSPPFASLPGGHLEFGEPLAAALSREVFEETGLNVEPEKLVYVHENFYRHRGVDTHEIGFYFLVDLSSEFPVPDARGYLASRESHLRLRLVPLADLGRVDLRPPFLRGALPRDARESFARPTQHVVSRVA
jgi:ADP-ribose pyrophosphatase YjhB (NUDIX family)